MQLYTKLNRGLESELDNSKDQLKVIEVITIFFFAIKTENINYF